MLRGNVPLEHKAGLAMYGCMTGLQTRGDTVFALDVVHAISDSKVQLVACRLHMLHPLVAAHALGVFVDHKISFTTVGNRSGRRDEQNEAQ